MCVCVHVCVVMVEFSCTDVFNLQLYLQDEETEKDTAPTPTVISKEETTTKEKKPAEPLYEMLSNPARVLPQQVQ